MDFFYGFLAASALSVIVWYFFPNIKQVETILFKDILDEVKYLEDDALEVVKQVGTIFASSGGEAKAHQALALLMKMYPGAPQWDIRMAIELAVKKCQSL